MIHENIISKRFERRPIGEQWILDHVQSWIPRDLIKVVKNILEF